MDCSDYDTNWYEGIDFHLKKVYPEATSVSI